MLWRFFHFTRIAFPYQSQKDIFLRSLPGEPGVVPESKGHNPNTHTLKLCPQEFLSLAINQNCCLNIPTSLQLQWLPLQISRFQLGFSRVWGSGLTYDLNSRISSRKVIDFQCVQTFIVVGKYRMMNSKFFTYQNWNHILLIKKHTHIFLVVGPIACQVIYIFYHIPDVAYK